MSELYDTDFVAWTSSQADLLRRMGARKRVKDQVDWENVAEEIESLGRSQERDLAFHVRTALENLLRLEASPVNDPWHGCRETVMRQRSNIRRLLKDSPSLRRTIDTVITDELPNARKIAAAVLARDDEVPRMPLNQLNYTEQQVLGPWLPGSSPGVAALAEAATESLQAAKRLKAGSRRRKRG